MLIFAAAITCGILLLDKTPSEDDSSADGSSQTESVDPYARDKFSASYYYVGDVAPEMSANRITATVNEMYFTNNGHLCVKLTFGNGTDKTMQVQTVSFEATNGYTQKVIAKISGAEVALPTGDILIPAGGTQQYVLYIAPEDILDKYDTFEAVSFTISVKGTAQTK